MRINWKRILFAAIWSELLLFVIYFPTTKYISSFFTFTVIATPEMFVLLFLGGLWVARKIESRFILHGVLVGIFANVLFVILMPLQMLLLGQSQASPSVGVDVYKAVRFVIVLIVFVALKILGAATGAYVGGKRKTAANCHGPQSVEPVFKD